LVSTLVLASAFTISGVAGANELSGDLFGNTFKQADRQIVVAQEDAAAAAGSEPVSKECLKFAADVDADLGEVLKAGCKPTVATR